MKTRIERAQSRLAADRNLLNSLSYENILKRGYCVLKKDGAYVTAERIQKGDAIQIIASDKQIDADVAAIRERNNG
jgi:exonuclease VII large subunit